MKDTKENPSSKIIKHVEIGEPTRMWVLLHALNVHLKNYPESKGYVDPKYESTGNYMVKQFEFYLANIMDLEAGFKEGAENLDRVKGVEGNKKAEYIEMLSAIMSSAIKEFIDALGKERPWDGRVQKLLEVTMDLQDPFGILDALIDKSIGSYELWYMGSQGAMFNASEQRIVGDFPITFLELKRLHAKIREMTPSLTGLTYKQLAERQPYLCEINGIIANEKQKGRGANNDTIAALLELRTSMTTPEWVSGEAPISIEKANKRLSDMINYRQIPVFSITERKKPMGSREVGFRANTAYNGDKKEKEVAVIKTSEATKKFPVPRYQGSSRQ